MPIGRVPPEILLPYYSLITRHRQVACSSLVPGRFVSHGTSGLGSSMQASDIILQHPAWRPHHDLSGTRVDASYVVPARDLIYAIRQWTACHQILLSCMLATVCVCPPQLMQLKPSPLLGGATSPAQLLQGAGQKPVPQAALEDWQHALPLSSGQ